MEGAKGDWEELKKPGLNGILSVMAGLFYWGRIAQRNAKQCKAWAADVEDCSFVLRQLLG